MQTTKDTTFIKLNVPVKLVTAVVVQLTTVLSAHALPSSTFQDSCDWGDRPRVEGNVFYISCKDEKGNYRPSQIELRGIHNEDGSLVQGDISSPSSFQDSCKDSVVLMLDVGSRVPHQRGPYYPFLKSQCLMDDNLPLDGHGNRPRRNASIRLDGISNDNGQLTYQKGSVPVGRPVK